MIWDWIFAIFKAVVCAACGQKCSATRQGWFCSFCRTFVDSKGHPK